MPRRILAVAAIWLAIIMAVLDSAIANVALPTIAGDLGAAPADAVWVINAYQIAITALLLPLAALGDRIGHARVLISALLIFILGSLFCALAGSLSSLIIARMVQGIGAAGIMSMNSALVRATYPSAMLGRGIGYNAVIVSLSAAAGPTVAAAILSVGSWPWLFAVNVPIGLCAVVLGHRCLPRQPGHGRRPDPVSAVLTALVMVSVIFGGESAARGASLWTVVPLLSVGSVLGVVLYRRERYRPMPLLPLDLLRIPVFALSIATSITSFAAQMLLLVSMPFFLQLAAGRSVLETGLLMTPFPIALAFVAPVAGRLADRMSAGLLGGIGLGLFALGLMALALLGSAPSGLDIGWRMALCGVGFGLFQSPNNRAMISAAPRERSGAAGGMLATARLLGQTTGAVGAASGFHWLGVESTPVILGVAALVAGVAMLVSLTRLRVGQVAPQPDAMTGNFP